MKNPFLQTRINGKVDRGRSMFLDLALLTVLVGGLVWLSGREGGSTGYNWQWYRVGRYLYTWDEAGFVPGPLLNGLWITMKITVISLVLSLLFGLTTALLRLSNSLAGRGVARLYLELIRNTPLLIQIFFIYFVLAPVLDLERFTSAVLALSLFEGAYASEIIRAGIVSLNRGQWEAAYSLGLSGRHTYQHIILPQALRRVLPPLTGQAISLVKDSALVSTIAIYDLTMEGQAIIAETFLTFEIWFTVAGIYLFINLALSVIVGVLEKKLKVKE